MPSTSSRLPVGRTLRSPRLELDSYFTDGVRLLRVVDACASRAFVSLEDCRTLEVRTYSPGQLVKLRLRAVERAP